MKSEYGFFRADGSLLWKRDMTIEEAFISQIRLLGDGVEVRPGPVGMDELDEVVIEPVNDFEDDEDDTGVFALWTGILV